MLNSNLAIFLAKCCKLTYDELKQNGKFKIPRGFTLIETFKMKSLDDTEWFGYMIESTDSIIVAFRGTVTDRDWIMDATAYQTPFPYASSNNVGAVHHGFLKLYMSCRNHIMNTLKSRSKRKTLYITGHSLGAALAVLHAFDVSLNLNFKHVSMLSFGGPRVGDPLFASTYDRNVVNSIRIVNRFDEIPKLPPKSIFWLNGHVYHYKHVKRPIYIAEQKGTKHLNHSLDTYIEGIKKVTK